MKQAGTALWEVIANVCNAIANSLGYVSLGAAENVILQDELLKDMIDNISIPSQASKRGYTTNYLWYARESQDNYWRRTKLSSTSRKEALRIMQHLHD